MDRVPEPELMLDAAQARAYAEADFEAPHSRFVALLAERLPTLPRRGIALDLGCGPGDITLRFARAFPGWRVDGVDASRAMLDLARVAAARAALTDRVAFHGWYLPNDPPPRDAYDLVFSNSLLHHLSDPAALWNWLRTHLAAGTPLFLMDLLRPDSPDAARRLVDQYAAGEPEVLRTDFYNSLRAAYRPDEGRAQLGAASLDTLQIAVVSDRHFIVCGALR